ncbi:MAG: hypothetical protein IIY82_06495 [Firmicutes bacterium]|nr:hypothetical protein [Bacillota bacterium]
MEIFNKLLRGKSFFGKRLSGELPKQGDAPDKQYDLECDFGCDITSPIPSVEPIHQNHHCRVPAVVGTTVELFPGERVEIAEFLSYLRDEQGEITGICCRIKENPGLYRFLNLPEPEGWEIELICGKKEYFETSCYENGKNTHLYRSLILLPAEGRKPNH